MCLQAQAENPDKTVEPAGANNASTTAVSSNATTTAQQLPVSPRQPVKDFETAQPCLQPPTANTSAADESARLWGWNDSQNTSCAFKDSAGHAVWYPEYIPGDWLHTPACSMPPFPDNSVVDSTLKVRRVAQHHCYLYRELFAPRSLRHAVMQSHPAATVSAAVAHQIIGPDMSQP
jgi:hypothetical protein